MRLASYYDNVAFWRCAGMVVLCMAFLALTPTVFAAGDEPIEVTVDPTWYDPALGGTNCNGDCSCIGPSSDTCMKPKDHYYGIAACDPAYYGWTVVMTSYHGEYIQSKCLDAGGNIHNRPDGVFRVDLLRREPLLRVDTPALFYPPGAAIPPRPEPVYEPPPPPPKPEFAVVSPGVCPIWICDPYLVKVQGITAYGVAGGTESGTAHWGVDLWTGSGGEVRAPWPAVVLFVGEHPGLGGYIELDYGDGYTSKVGHLEPAVAAGWELSAGQLIGYVDDSGITRDNAHVHFELWRDGQALDVLEVLLSEEQPGV